MAFELEYFWAVLLLFIMERICCLQEQFDKDFSELPEDVAHITVESFASVSDIEEFSTRDSNLRLSFLRLGHLMHILIMLTLVYFCNICVWFMITKPSMPRVLRYRFHVRPLLRRLGSF